MDPKLLALAIAAGIHFPPGARYLTPDARMALDQQIAQDAQTALVTTSNAGIPSFLSTYVDPKIIDVLVAPMKAAIIVGDEGKKGDWTTSTAMFPVIESTGETTSYGDYENGGVADANINWPQRQSYHYQVITKWGELELDRAGLARVDLANRKNIASVLTLNKFQNKSYFFGVAGLENRGLLNDSDLTASITPTTKAATGTEWFDSSGNPNATALEVLADIQKLYRQLQSQANGLVELDTKMALAMSPISQAALTFTTQYNVNVEDLLKKNFPNMRIETAPEYTTASGEFVQLIAEEVEGQRTASCQFTEKLRAHPVKVDHSSFSQKKSQGSWGTVIFRPFLIANMLGV